MDSVRGVEAAIELYKDPEYGTGRSLLIFLFISGFVHRFSFRTSATSQPTQSKRNLQNVVSPEWILFEAL